MKTVGFGRRRRRAPAAGLIALLLLAAGAAAGRLSSLPPREGSPEVAFARAMTRHHEQAVAMALAIRDRTDDPPIRTLALDIALTQQAQIGRMEGWLATWGVPLAGPRVPAASPSMPGMTMPGMTMPGMATRPEVNALSALPVEQAETRFMQLMIRHHQGGVSMAEQALRTVRRPEVRALATSIVNAQRSEIEYLTQLLRGRAQEGPPGTTAPGTTAPETTDPGAMPGMPMPPTTPGQP